jgi:hypothetical protein
VRPPDRTRIPKNLDSGSLDKPATDSKIDSCPTWSILPKAACAAQAFLA